MKKYTINPSQIQEYITSIFEKAGIPSSDAQIASEILVSTEMRGVSSHGIMRVEKYVNCLLKGGIHPKATSAILQEDQNFTIFDAHGGLGLIASQKAMQNTIDKANTSSVAVAFVKNSRHFGAAGYYSLMCARQNKIGLSMSNGDIIMAVSGSGTSSIGNDRFSFAAPAGKYGDVVLDMAMSKVSDGKVQIAELNREQLDPGSILDRQGHPSVLPSDYLNGGTLLPFGEHKGYGLAVMVEILAGILSGSSLLKNARAWNEDPKSTEGVGHFFLALNFEKFLSLDLYNTRVESMIEELVGSPKKVGAERIYFPGEIENLKEKEARASGITVIDACALSLERAAKKVGITQSIFDLLTE